MIEVPLAVASPNDVGVAVASPNDVDVYSILIISRNKKKKKNF